jgi:hypothetical protein
VVKAAHRLAKRRGVTGFLLPAAQIVSAEAAPAAA